MTKPPGGTTPGGGTTNTAKTTATRWIDATIIVGATKLAFRAGGGAHAILTSQANSRISAEATTRILLHLWTKIGNDELAFHIPIPNGPYYPD